MAKAALALCLFAVSLREGLGSDVEADLSKNPVRRVVTMLQAMAKKVEAEGKKEQELYDNFMCYCRNGGSELQESIGGNTAKVPQLQSEIESAEASKSQTEADLKAHQEGRAAAKASQAQAVSVREKQAAEYAKEYGDVKTNSDALGKAIPAIEKGMAGGFLQAAAGRALLHRLNVAVAAAGADISEMDRETATAFLTEASSGGYIPKGGEIVGILKEMKAGFDKDIAALNEEEDTAKASHEELVKSLTKEINTHTSSIEKKTKRAGELGISIVAMKADLGDSEAALIEDQKMQRDLEKNCATKEAEWGERVKTRAEELVAIHDTIKILNDDDALELFKKTLPSPTLLQVQAHTAGLRNRAFAVLENARSTTDKPRNSKVDFILAALTGKKVNFDSVIKMIDDLVALLGQEQADDDNKQEYCRVQLESGKDAIKDVTRTIGDLEASVAASDEALKTLKTEIATLTKAISALDKQVAEATEQRKEENSEYTQSTAENNAAKELLGFAKNRLNKFYNKELYLPPPKKELSREGRIASNFGEGDDSEESFVQVSQHLEPPPETFGAYTKKSGETGGVIAMIDLLIRDIDKEMTEAKVDEKNAQSIYEDMMDDGAAKRAQDTRAVADKEKAKADTELSHQADAEELGNKQSELLARGRYQQDLHAECDWLLQNYDLRKEARANEVDQLKEAKAILSGADFSLVQLRAKAPTVDVEALKAQLTGSKVFQDKVAQACNGAGAECESKAKDALFCQLVQRTQPELSAQISSYCGGHAAPSLLQLSAAPEDDLAKEMTHDLEMNFNKIAPFGKEDTAKELQDHAAKTQDTLVDAVENAEVAEIKRAVFRALTRLRAATIKEFDTIARLETQAIDAYNDAHHYRAENPLAHLHEDEAPVETDKLKSFH